MTMIKHVAVIGAGVMGSGIAAHAANAGAEVTLLDVDAARADAGVHKQLATGGFMDPELAKGIRAGSFKEDIKWLEEADWIVEAVAERLEIKQSLFRDIAKVMKPEAIVSSNTSTIPLHQLVRGLPEQLASRLMITHFFNPPRVMRLLELVAGPQTDPGAVQAIHDFADHKLGKGVVHCHDTPGFIGNRIGNYWLLLGLKEAVTAGVDVEEVDAVIAKPFGIPRSGIFGLIDLIGIDLMKDISRSFQLALPASDAMNVIEGKEQFLEQMIGQGQLGRKTGAGFYRLSKDRTVREVIDFSTGEYRSQRPSDTASKADPRTIMESDTPIGAYCSLVMRRTLAYAVSLIPEIAKTPHDVDRAMMLGYGWKHGPFQLIDQLGVEWFAKHLREHEEPVPHYLEAAVAAGGFYAQNGNELECLLPTGDWCAIYPDEGVLPLPSVTTGQSPVRTGEFATLWDMGDDVALLELHAKMNVLGHGLVSEIQSGLRASVDGFKALVVGTGGKDFSAGADLKEFSQHIDLGQYAAIAELIESGQRLMREIKYAPIPVVAAAQGMALGGGCELLLHCSAVVTHAELNAGLVEPLVGLVPAWGGCKEMLGRLSNEQDEPMDPVGVAQAAFKLISRAAKSNSAAEARRLGFLRKSDLVVMNVERILGEAKQEAMRLADGYRPPKPWELRLSGSVGMTALDGQIELENGARFSPVSDRVLAHALAEVLTGGPTAGRGRLLHEEDISLLEKQAFMQLIERPSTRERIGHMLKTGKPLGR